MFDLKGFSKECFDIVKLRMKKGDLKESDYRHIERDTLKHLASEVLEATGAFEKWGTVCEYTTELERHHGRRKVQKAISRAKREFEVELADVIICCLTLAEIDGIDIEEALCMARDKNRKRVPEYKATQKFYQKGFKGKESVALLRAVKDIITSENTTQETEELKMEIWEALGGIAK